MDDHSLFNRRFSCRSFRADQVPRELVRELLEAARWAPTAGNLQPWRFAVVLDASLRGAIAHAAYGQSFLASAPALVVVCAVPEDSARLYGPRGKDLYCVQDTAAAAENILLAATVAGLGSCWVGAFDEAAVARLLDLAPSWRPVAVIAIGFPAEKPGRRTRRSLHAVTRWFE